MLLRTYLGKILFLFSAIVGIPALVGEARHINFQARLDKCVVECRRVRLQNPGRGVPSLPPCSDICLNRTKADCPLSSGHLDWTPSSVNVTFHQYPNSSNWYINITWTPLNDSSANWTNIFVRLTIEIDVSSSRTGPLLCIVLPKNQTFLIVDNSSNGWSYPKGVLLHVTALPYSNKGVDMYFHAPPESSNTTAKTTVAERSSTTAKTTSCDVKYDSVDWYAKDVNAVFSNDSGDWSANISWTPLTELNITWTGYLITINLAAPPGGFSYNVICAKLPKDKPFLVLGRKSSLGWTYPQAIFVNVTKLPAPYSSEGAVVKGFYPLGDHKSVWSTESQTITRAPATPKSSFPLLIVVSSLGAFVGLLLVVGLWWKKRRTVQPVETSPSLRFKYHAFVIFNSNDQDWVDNTLISTLERTHHLKCCVHYRNFTPGTVFTDSMVQSVWNSFKVIAVVSRHFFSSNYCDFELNHALSRLLNKRDDCLIVIKLDDSVDVRLPRELLTRSYIDYTSATERQTWETKLVNILKQADLESSDEDESEPNNNEGHTDNVSVTDRENRDLIDIQVETDV